MTLLVHGELGDGRDVDVAAVVAELEVDELVKNHALGFWYTNANVLGSVFKDVGQNFRSCFGCKQMKPRMGSDLNHETCSKIKKPLPIISLLKKSW